MMRTQDSVQYPPSSVQGRWTVRARDRKTGLVVAEKQVKNIWTTYGLTALASAISGAYTPPQYLVIESNYATFTSASTPGATSIQVSKRVDQPGDTQIVLGVGLSTQETVTFTGVTSTGSVYTYTLSPGATYGHALGDAVCRQPTASDTMGSVVGEMQYDAINFPGQRILSPGGYSAGSGNWTIQYFFPGPSAQGFIILVGMADAQAIGQGNLHNHFVLGYSHTSTSTDLEIDGSITLLNG